MTTDPTTDLSRRRVLVGAAASAAALGVAAAAGAQSFGNSVAPPTRSFGNPDSPAEGRINAKSPSTLDDPGPQNPALASQLPSFQDPPATDINGIPLLWSAFNHPHQRDQHRGW